MILGGSGGEFSSSFLGDFLGIWVREREGKGEGERIRYNLP